jgi:sugar/nucleoside kinase (ribokinase family)
MAQASVEVVHVGSAARDIAADDPRGWRLGGGVTYAALTTARLGLATAAIIGVDEAASGARELDILRDAGVDLLLAPLEVGPVFHNVEVPGGREQTIMAVGRPLHPMLLPESWRRASAWSFTPVAGELGDEWAAMAGPATIVAVGWQGMLRGLVAGQPVERLAPSERALVRRADLMGLSHHDVDPSTPLASLAELLHPGARMLVTQGHLGGLLIDVTESGPAGTLRYLPTRTDREVDATGAGDTFLAALLAATVRPSILGLMRRRLGADLRFAAAAGSLAVEGIGLAGVPDLFSVRARAVRERVRRLVVPSEDVQVTVETTLR